MIALLIAVIVAAVMSGKFYEWVKDQGVTPAQLDQIGCRHLL